SDKGGKGGGNDKGGNDKSGNSKGNDKSGNSKGNDKGSTNNSKGTGNKGTSNQSKGPKGKPETGRTSRSGFADFDRFGNYVGGGIGGYNANGDRVEDGGDGGGGGLGGGGKKLPGQGGKGGGKGKGSGNKGGNSGKDQNLNTEEEEEEYTPPPEVWTYSGSGCSSYLDHWDLKWSSCAINSDWSGYSDPTVSCKQDSIETPIYRSCGYWETSNYGGKRCVTSGCRPDEKKPNRPPKYYNIGLDYIGNNCSSAYADAVSSCAFSFQLVGSPAEGLSGFSGLALRNFTYSGGHINQLNQSGESGVSISNTSIGGYSASASATSVVPFSDSGTLSFDIRGKSGFSRVGYNSIGLTFIKPAVMSALTIHAVGQESKNPEVGRDQKYNIGLESLGNLNHVNSGYLGLESKHISIADPHQAIFQNINKNNLNFTVPNTTLVNAFNQTLDVKIESKDKILSAIAVKVLDMPISYVIKGKRVHYIVEGKKINGDSAMLIKGCEKRTLGVKILGTGKHQGKGDKTGQDTDFVNLNQEEVRKNIHKNANDLIRNRDTGKKINQVYFNDKTTIYSNISNDLADGDTVIIKNGNFVIDQNIDKQIGIIVLKDGYNVSPETPDGGNIFITKDVTNIKAYIYSDGAIMSKDVNGKNYKDEELAIPLAINGSIFSRNTIGGAVAGIGDNKYLLPGGKKTSDFKLAEKYDLNYLRKAKLCGEQDFSLKLNYESGIQSNPPKGFTIE
ncbi:hypothetical protein HXK64_02320, partial [Candidatus Gracilibacteria bacterium]|nr:hypothetical protein [Candidatus Gracilibacteria bacterium]